MFYFTYHESDYTADDDGNVSSEYANSAELAAAQAYWTNEGWQQAEQDAADEYGDYKYEQWKDDRDEA